MIPERYASSIYAAFRIVFGFLFLLHGLQKFGLVGGMEVPFFGAGPIGAAKAIEPICGTLIMLGLFTRPAAFIASGQMAVAYFLVHQPMGGWPVQNGGELAVHYCFAFLYMAARGGGVASLDALMKSQKR
jgi:putative oxidoreductase